ncbi:hypothetical protein TIFTF001_040569 [Ficus carica]|uniref:Uncharacterized protein n=1 Tax=Ficus carica TaxID=3494 RepID=A0AA87ZB32_FICCA|nr:hypothetical protein TIFTF001_040569 [Ficus carica]
MSGCSVFWCSIYGRTEIVLFFKGYNRSASEIVSWAGKLLGDFLVFNGIGPLTWRNTWPWEKGAVFAKACGLVNWVLESDALNAVSVVRSAIDHAPEANIADDIRDITHALDARFYSGTLDMRAIVTPEFLRFIFYRNFV